MFKISKLFNSEIKKIFSGPGVFIMSAILILLLTICPKLFSPTVRMNIASETNISTSSVTSSYDSFLLEKTIYDSKVAGIFSDINEYIANNANFKQKLIDDFASISATMQAFHLAVLSENISGENGCFDTLNTLRVDISQLYNEYNSLINDHITPLLLVSEELNYQIDSQILALKRLVLTTGNNSYSFYQNIDETIDNFGYMENIQNVINQTKNLSYSNTTLSSILSNYSNLKVAEKNEILSEMQALCLLATNNAEENLSRENISTMRENALLYLSFTNNAYNIMQSKFLLSITAGFSDSAISKYLGYENFNAYYHTENFTRHLYLIQNNLAENEVSGAFSFGVNSAESTNAFDYMFFSLEIISLLIVTFSVIIGAGMVSKEYTDGTIKLLAIRPYSRNKIILSKILATMFVGFMFALVSAVVTFVTAVVIYGLSFPQMLLIFNATTAFVIPNWVAFLIYFGLLLIKIWLFSLIAIAISTIFKSYILAFCLSAGLYIVNIIVTFIARGASWLRFNIFSHFDLFKYFGGSFTENPGSNNVASLFSTSVFSDMNLWLSGSIVLSLFVVLNVLIFFVFRNRDLA